MGNVGVGLLRQQGGKGVKQFKKGRRSYVDLTTRFNVKLGGHVLNTLVYLYTHRRSCQ